MPSTSPRNILEKRNSVEQQNILTWLTPAFLAGLISALLACSALAVMSTHKLGKAWIVGIITPIITLLFFPLMKTGTARWMLILLCLVTGVWLNLTSINFMFFEAIVFGLVGTIYFVNYYANTVKLFHGVMWVLGCALSWLSAIYAYGFTPNSAKNPGHLSFSINDKGQGGFYTYYDEGFSFINSKPFIELIPDAFAGLVGALILTLFFHFGVSRLRQRHFISLIVLGALIPVVTGRLFYTPLFYIPALHIPWQIMIMVILGHHLYHSNKAVAQGLPIN